MLFYDSDSLQSGEVFAFLFPGLFERYGTRLQVSGIDLSGHKGAQAYRAATERFDLPPHPDGEPAVVVGDRVVVGLIAIAATLGDDFENLVRDPTANRWPPIPALEELLPGGIEDVKARVAAEAVPLARDDTRESSDELSARDQIANGLAVMVLLGMMAALIHSLVRLRQHNKIPGSATSVALLFAVLVGLGISGYTAYTALAEAELMCGPIGGCAAIQESEYSKLFGIPMGVLGLIGYSVILVSWLMARHLSPQGGGWHWLPWGVALFGMLFSLRLTALGPFLIGATCLWCLGSAISITIAFWLLSAYVRKGERIA